MSLSTLGYMMLWVESLLFTGVILIVNCCIFTLWMM